MTLICSTAIHLYLVYVKSVGPYHTSRLKVAEGKHSFSAKSGSKSEKTGLGKEGGKKNLNWKYCKT